MCNGLCEKFNGVLKKILKAYARSKPKTWDEYIPYLLFAYREVPNESTGFSEFGVLSPLLNLSGNQDKVYSTLIYH
jgi:hypothetical protein